MSHKPLNHQHIFWSTKDGRPQFVEVPNRETTYSEAILIKQSELSNTLTGLPQNCFSVVTGTIKAFTANSDQSKTA